MFQSLARNATAAARPVKMSGVARVKVSSKAKLDPAAPRATRENTEKGDAPLSSTRPATIRKDRKMASAGNKNRSATEVSLLGSSRMARLRLGQKAMARHHQADRADIGGATHERLGDATAIGH